MRQQIKGGIKQVCINNRLKSDSYNNNNRCFGDTLSGVIAKSFKYVFEYVRKLPRKLSSSSPVKFSSSYAGRNSHT